VEQTIQVRLFFVSFSTLQSRYSYNNELIGIVLVSVAVDSSGFVYTYVNSLLIFIHPVLLICQAILNIWLYLLLMLI
jgi:hypothetical protein